MGKNQIFFGRNVLKEAVACELSISKVFVENDATARWLLTELPHLRQKMEQRIPKQIAKHAHQGLAFETSYDFYRGPEPSWQEYQSIVLCNGIQDVQNLGAIARSAAAFGVQAIVHESRKSARMDAVGVKISMGQAFRLRFVEVSNLANLARKLKENNFWLTGLEGGASRALYDWKPSFPLALVVGSEAEGIGRNLQKQLHESLFIPMGNGVESLNASHATSIALSWVFSQK